MKKIYSTPSVKIKSFGAVNVITLSGEETAMTKVKQQISGERSVTINVADIEFTM